MSTSKTFIIRPDNEEQVNALKAFAKALQIRFEIFVDDPYDQDFIVKIEESKKQYKKGEYTRVAKEDLESYLGLK